MPVNEWSSNQPTLAEMKERGENALAETRRIINDIKNHAVDVRRDIVMGIHHGYRAR